MLPPLDSCPADLKSLLSPPIDLNQIHSVLWHGDLEILRWYLEVGAELDVKHSGETGLVYAIRDSRKQGLRQHAMLLIEHGADVNIKNSDGETPLLWAAYNGDVELVELLLSKNARLQRAGHGFDRKSPLHMACEYQHPEVVRLLLAAGAKVDETCSGGRTPLILAAAGTPFIHHSHELLALLIESGADVNARDKGGRTALYWCALKSLRDSVELLLHRGANPNPRLDGESPLGETPLDVAKTEEVVALLKAAGAPTRELSDPFSFHEAIRKGDLDAFRAALEAGADPNCRYDQEPALLRAVLNSQKEMVRVLIERGCKLNVRGARRESALHQVTGRGKSSNLDIGQMLLEAGAKADLKDRAGRTPLELRTEASDLKAMTLLLEAGASPTRPFRIAVEGGRLRAARLLVERGAMKRLGDEDTDTLYELARKNLMSALSRDSKGGEIRYLGLMELLSRGNEKLEAKYAKLVDVLQPER
ncbi:MAG: ankyrin repeat domain-containing protein [Thermoanaerobaculia bacterium]|nr:ankyrin repeat domain-containing protein [Thermoanaerobaculia bacterium]